MNPLGMMKNKKLMAILIVALFAILLVTGVIPGLTLLVTTTTENDNIGDYSGYGELIQPNDRKGFITSYKRGGHSETISIIGKIHVPNFFSMGHVAKYKYVIKAKKQGDIDWTVISKPGMTGSSMAITNPNPGELSPPGTIPTGGVYYFKNYDFNFLGDIYNAVRAEFWVYGSGGGLFEPLQWRSIQIDEAYLHSGGIAGLFLPRGIEDGVSRPYDTFEIGQVVDIRVETGAGGYTIEGEGQKTWRVTLNEPYSSEIGEDPSAGGGVIHEQWFNDFVTNGHFRFTVTEKMADTSMRSTDPYSIRIWNTFYAKGTLYVDFIDFISKAPGDVTIECVEQAKIGEKVSASLSADVNTDTQNVIDYFRVSVIHGDNNVLLPSDPNSNRWIIHTTNYDATANKATIEFVPKLSFGEQWVTIHTKAVDVEGRASVRTQTWTLYAYADKPVDPDMIEDTTGQHDYGGGYTSDWLSWSPEGGNWDLLGYTFMSFIVAIAIIGISALIAVFAPVPLHFRVLIPVIGALIAVVTFFWMNNAF